MRAAKSGFGEAGMLDARASDAAALPDSAKRDASTKPGLPPECDGAYATPPKDALAPDCTPACLWELFKNCPADERCGVRRVEYIHSFSYQVYWNDVLCYSYWYRPPSFQGATSTLPVFGTYTDPEGNVVATEVRPGVGAPTAVYCGSVCIPSFQGPVPEGGWTYVRCDTGAPAQPEPRCAP